MLLFIFFFLTIIAFYLATLFIISYALVTFTLRKITNNWFIRMFSSVLVATILGYLLIISNEIGISRDYGRQILGLLTLFSAFLISERYYKTNKAQNDNTHTNLREFPRFVAFKPYLINRSISLFTSWLFSWCTQWVASGI